MAGSDLNLRFGAARTPGAEEQAALLSGRLVWRNADSKANAIDRVRRAVKKQHLVSAFAVNVFALSLAVVAALSAPPAKQTFTGTITDDMCPKANHSRMQMGPTDAECARACADVHGASYVLYDGKNIYMLSDQQTPEKFAGQKVKVVGTLDPKTDSIQVDSITADK
jgi:hypothetical protein